MKHDTAWIRMVPGAGLEPARPRPADFKSAASTNSATRARYVRYGEKVEAEPGVEPRFTALQAAAPPLISMAYNDCHPTLPPLSQTADSLQRSIHPTERTASAERRGRSAVRSVQLRFRSSHLLLTKKSSRLSCLREDHNVHKNGLRRSMATLG